MIVGGGLMQYYTMIKAKGEGRRELTPQNENEYTFLMLAFEVETIISESKALFLPQTLT